MSQTTFFSVQKSEAQRSAIIVDNILKMLSKRIFINKTGEKESLIDYTEGVKNITDHKDNIYTLKTNNNLTYAFKITFSKLSSIGKSPDIADFLKKYSEHKKIIVATEFNNRILDHIDKHETQIFLESTLMQDILDYFDQPRFEMLSPKERELVLKEYGLSDYTMKKIKPIDPISKYFGLKKGDVIRVIRPSPIAGETIDYRVVC